MLYSNKHDFLKPMNVKNNIKCHQYVTNLFSVCCQKTGLVFLENRPKLLKETDKQTIDGQPLIRKTHLRS